MTVYTDTFGNQTIPPAGVAYRSISLTASVSLFWPSNYEGPDYIGVINDVTASNTGYVITLDSAMSESTGFDILFNNVGSNSFAVHDNAGNVLATIAAGVVKYLYLTDNSTDAGVWRVTTYGTGTSAADASALVGYGMTVIGGTLNTAHPVQTSSSTFTMAAADRAQVYVSTGGSVALNLLDAATAGNNFFVGVRNAGSGSLTITPHGADTIDGLSTITLVPGESAFIFCNGSTWYSVGYGRSTTFQFTKLVKDVSAGGTFTLTTSEAANKLMQFTGTPASNVTIIVPTVVAIYYIQNAYSATGSYTLTIKTAAGTGIQLSNTDRVIAYCDAVNVVAATSVSVGTNLSIIDGTAAAPSINFSSDTDTGFYRKASNTIGIATGGVEAAEFAPTGATIPGTLGVTGAVSTAGSINLTGTSANSSPGMALLSTNYLGLRGGTGGITLQNNAGNANLLFLTDAGAVTIPGTLGVTGAITGVTSGNAPKITSLVKTANYSVNANESVLADTSGGAFTITLPGSPAQFDRIGPITDSPGTWDTNNLTIARNSLKIMGIAEDMVCSTKNGSFSLEYDNAGNGWRIIQ